MRAHIYAAMAGVWKLAAAVAAVSALMMACSATVPKPDRPNVMVVVVDDLRCAGTRSRMQPPWMQVA